MQSKAPRDMLKPFKISLIALGASVAAFAALAGVAVMVLRVDAKPRLEALASDALGMQVHIGGSVAVSLFPGLHFALRDVHVVSRGTQIASAGEVDLGIELLPLLQRQVRANRVQLKRLALLIERDRSGTLNLDAAPASAATLQAVSVTSLSVSEASLNYADRRSGERVEAAACTLELHDLRLAPGSYRSALRNLGFAGTLDCAQIRTRDFEASDVAASISGQNGSFTLDPLTLRLFDGHGSGDVRADFTGAVAGYSVRYRLTQFRLEEFFRNVSPKSIGSGLMDFSATLALHGDTTTAMVASAEGVAALHGEHLTLATGDLDAKLSHYESSQRLNLIDFGAFLFAGPLGLAVTKSYNYARIFQGAPGTTDIRTLASEWRVQHGVAVATDVAMATPKNRVALTGGLDFVSGRYDQVTVAVIDARGCVIVQQHVEGPFLNPDLKQPNVLGTITGPARNLLRQAGNLLGAKCPIFYTGTVTPPK
jgi:AsmA protein